MKEKVVASDVQLAKTDNIQVRQKLEVKLVF